MGINFKRGDRVILRRPKSLEERNRSPMWTPSMDDFDGKVVEVSGVNLSGFIQVKGTHFIFHKSWMHLEGTEAINANDGKYYKVCNKIREMNHRRKTRGYLF